MEPMKLLTQRRTALTALSLIAALAVSLASPASAQTASSTPLTADQIAARRALAQIAAEESLRQLEEATSNMMAQAEQWLAEYRKTHPAPTAAQLAAQQATYAVIQQEQFQTNFAPWLVQHIPMPDGSFLTTDGLQSHSQSDLLALSATLSEVYAQRDAAVAHFVNTNPWEVSAGGTDENGGRYLIDSFDPLGAPVIKSTLNLESAQTVGAQKLWPGGSSGLGLTGTNVLIGQWDGGDAQTNHQEFWLNGFNVKLLNGPSGYGIDWHATHVAGTLAAYGGILAAEGFANRAKVLESVFYRDIPEMPGVVATNAMRVSNHSYGNLGGWLQTVIAGSNTWLWAGNDAISITQDWHFGFYDAYAQTNDAIIYSAQTYMPRLP